MTASRSPQRCVWWPTSCHHQLILASQVVGIGQSIALLRAVDDGLGKKENTLSSVQVMDVQKVRSCFSLEVSRGRREDVGAICIRYPLPGNNLSGQGIHTTSAGTVGGIATAQAVDDRHCRRRGDLGSCRHYCSGCAMWIIQSMGFVAAQMYQHEVLLDRHGCF
jgi:hypothetical protein